MSEEHTAGHLAIAPDGFSDLQADFLDREEWLAQSLMALQIKSSVVLASCPSQGCRM